MKTFLRIFLAVSVMLIVASCKADSPKNGSSETKIVNTPAQWKKSDWQIGPQCQSYLDGYFQSNGLANLIGGIGGCAASIRARAAAANKILDCNGIVDTAYNLVAKCALEQPMTPAEQAQVLCNDVDVVHNGQHCIALTSGDK